MADRDRVAQLTPREREVGKLGLSQSEDDHRRVLAVLAYLRASVA